MPKSEIAKITPQDEVCRRLAEREKDFKTALPPQIPSARFVRVAQTAVRNNPKIVECDRATLYSAFFKCAADGLLPDGREAAIVPFGSTAQYMPMVQGICKKARNSGEIKTINAQVVFKNDIYEHWIDESGEHFKHVPARGDRGEPILAYAFSQTKDNGVFFEELDMVQLKAIEGMSRQKGGPWSGPFRTEMMRKSAIRRLLKYRVPSSSDIDELIRQDDPIYDKDPEPPKPAETTSSRLRGIVETTATTATTAPTVSPATPSSPTPSEEAQELAVQAGEELPL